MAMKAKHLSADEGDGYRVRVTREVWVAASNLREASL